MMKQAVIAGLGVAMVSRLAIQTEIAAGLLVELKVKGLKIRYPIHHGWRKGWNQSRIAPKFLDLLLPSVDRPDPFRLRDRAAHLGIDDFKTTG